jgi:hypothetical protein
MERPYKKIVLMFSRSVVATAIHCPPERTVTAIDFECGDELGRVSISMHLGYLQ